MAAERFVSSSRPQRPRGASTEPQPNGCRKEDHIPLSAGRSVWLQRSRSQMAAERLSDFDGDIDWHELLQRSRSQMAAERDNRDKPAKRIYALQRSRSQNGCGKDWGDGRGTVVTQLQRSRGQMAAESRDRSQRDRSGEVAST